MSQDSIVSARLFQWHVACDAWDFEIDPPFSQRSLLDRAPGEVHFRAGRMAVIDGERVSVSLTVAESWFEGEHPEGDRRLEQEGCHLASLGWHLQVGTDAGAPGAERLDVGPPDSVHPRIHRHPYGELNDVRVAAELPPPEAWLHGVNGVLGGALDDGLQEWDDLADEED